MLHGNVSSGLTSLAAAAAATAEHVLLETFLLEEVQVSVKEQGLVLLRSLAEVELYCG